MALEPHGVYRTRGIAGRPHSVWVEGPDTAFDMDEDRYRTAAYSPLFELLRWKDEYDAMKESGGKNA
jgi:hypothetical protein